MFKIFIFIIMVLIISGEAQVTLLDQLNYFAGQSQYAHKVFSKLQAPFSLDSVMSSGMELAMDNCQRSFKWERWNCPTSDFFLRQTTESHLMDREDAYTSSITTAAMLYTITKNCSSGIVAGCGSCSDNPYTSQCSDNPQVAEKLFRKHVNSDFSNDFYGKLSGHNFKAITNLLEKSLTKQCTCAIMSPGGVCAKEVCLQILKPFEEIANDIRQMYDEGIQLDNTPENSLIMWKNIPLDALVYMKDSPNYCEPDAVPHWNGVGGRQCSTGVNGEEALPEEDRLRCQHLCRECGYSVRPQNVVIETRCNCRFTWGFQVQCEKCLTVQKQYYCY